jgi:sterol 3beta-glucosyltransferase
VTSKTITLLASGTRGDVQPYLALGCGLRAAGYHVRLAAHDAYAAFVKTWDLVFFSLGENPSDLFARAEHQDALRAGQNPLRTLRASYAYWQRARPVYAKLAQHAWRAAQDSDALIFGLPTFWAGALASARHIPGVQALMQPLTPTRAFPCPLLPISSSLGGAGNRLSYLFCAMLMHWAWRDALNAWHKRFQIPRVPTTNIATPTLYGFSAHIVPRPSDYPPQHQITGFWFLPDRAWQPPMELDSFLRAGDAPVYVGFGSAPVRDARGLNALLIDAQRATGLRFLLPRTLAEETLPRASFYALDDVPHTWLFPRVRAVIHHGGAGTTAAALRAGVPQIIVPMYSDSFFWSARLFDKGVAPRPLPETKLSADALIDALELILRDNAMQARARDLSKAIAREQGVTRAVDLLCVLI